MASDDKPDKPGDERWRLGAEPRAVVPLKEPAPPASVAERDLSAERLERPLYTLTVEHLCYVLVAMSAVASRLLWLGRRPLSPAEALLALFDLDLSRGGETVLHRLPSSYSPLMRLAGASLMSALGASDSVARLGSALAGLLLVAAAFALRPWLGRAGALALGALLVLSPSATYFSRTDASVVPAMALTLTAVALALAFFRRPRPLLAVAAAAAAALALSADPSAYVTGVIFVAAMVVLATWSALFDESYFERLRYWWVQHIVVAVFALAIGVVLWHAFGTSFETGGFGRLRDQIFVNWRGGSSPGYRAGLEFYLPLFKVYEFLLVLMALAGMLLFLFGRLRSRFAGWCFIWTAASLAFYLWTPVRAARLSIEMVVPMALMGALAFDYLHHRAAWRAAGFPLLVLAAMTLYVAILTNFVFDAPDAGEAPWARHASLYWSEPATTVQGREESARLARSIRASAHGPRAGVFFEGDLAALRWYLRDVPRAASAEEAAAIVTASAGGTAPGAAAERSSFELEDQWVARLGDASPGEIIRYLFTQRAWSPLQTREATIIVSGGVPTGAPPLGVVTLPVPPPAAGALPTASMAPSPGPSPIASASPSSSGSSTSSVSPAPAVSPTPGISPAASPTVAELPAAGATPSPTATISATSTPASTESAAPSATPAPTLPGISETPTPGPGASPTTSPSAPAIPLRTSASTGAT